jgi:UPF0176 protein
MVSGAPAAIDAMKLMARKEWGVSPSAFKEAPCSTQSFTRLLVKIKNELIPIGDQEIRPHETTGTYLSAQTLKRWLDEGRPITLLDTRNDYEVKTGTFQRATDLKLRSSREFVTRAAEALRTQPQLFRDAPVVTFCTGGIRCEKASAALLKLGLKEVFQLEGGILRYFEENGSAHFSGDCFVFDWRLAVNGDLKPVTRSLESGRHRGGAGHAFSPPDDSPLPESDPLKDEVTETALAPVDTNCERAVDSQ